MDQNREFIKKNLLKMLPSSIKKDIVSFVFYDQHPRDERSIDVTVYTNRSEVLEFYQHQVISSLLLEISGTVTDLIIHRNNKSELFYLVVAGDEIVIILSKKDKLEVVNKVSNVESYTIEDSECTGQALLKIIQKDDAVPLVFDDNFTNLTPKQIDVNSVNSEGSLPIIQQLMKKLTEARYTTNHNKKKYEDYLNMRQAAAFSLYKRATFKLADVPSKLSVNEVLSLLQVTIKPPVIKMCNKKIVIIIHLKNNNNVPIKDVCILLHSDMKTSTEHCTKVFESVSNAPYWKETDAQVPVHCESTVVSVIELDEVQFEVGRIELELTISFTKSEKVYMSPVDNVSLSSSDIMGENFDILFNKDIDTAILVLCVLSTSERFDLHLRHITRAIMENVTLSDVFYTHLKMEKCLENVALNNVPTSQFHKLYGIMVVFNDNVKDTNIMSVSVYTRSSSQILALMHYIYDTVPYRIIATTSDYKISEINNDLSNYNECSQTNDKVNYSGCATSITNQIKLIREYFDECVSKMCEDQSPEVQSRIGKEVDLMALGVPSYLKFRNQILEENLRGLKSLSLELSDDADTDCMIID